MSNATRTIELSAEITAVVEVTKALRTETYSLDGDGPFTGRTHLDETREVRLIKAGKVVSSGEYHRFPQPIRGATGVVGSMGISAASAEKIEAALAEALTETETEEIAAFRAARDAQLRAEQKEIADLEAFQARVRRGMHSDA